MSLPPDLCRLAVMANSDPALSMRVPRKARLAFQGRMCQQAKPRLRLTAQTGTYVHARVSHLIAEPLSVAI